VTSAASAAELADATRDGDRGALARLLTIVESGGDAARTGLAALRPVEAAAVIGVTGAPGAGKSTLANRIVERVRAAGERVAVLAIDPTSAFTGGAILGDRVRMQAHDVDPGVFIRSMATRGHLGGLTRATPQAIHVVAAAGFPWVVVETVGVGQVEVAIAGSADTVVVVVNPGWGDGVQASKAGLLEIGDVFVVNKADRDGVAATRHDLEGMLALAGRRSWTPPIVETVATDGRGVDDLWNAVCAHGEHLAVSGERESRIAARAGAELRGVVDELAQRAADDACASPRFSGLAEGVARGEIDPYGAAQELLDEHGGVR
jgi:LAO/AO transport system kinase